MRNAPLPHLRQHVTLIDPHFPKSTLVPLAVSENDGGSSFRNPSWAGPAKFGGRYENMQERNCANSYQGSRDRLIAGEYSLARQAAKKKHDSHVKRSHRSAHPMRGNPKYD